MAFAWLCCGPGPDTLPVEVNCAHSRALRRDPVLCHPGGCPGKGPVSPQGGKAHSQHRLILQAAARLSGSRKQTGACFTEATKRNDIGHVGRGACLICPASEMDSGRGLV